MPATPIDKGLRQKAFLAQLQTSASLSDACTAAGVSIRTVQRWRAADPTFAEAVEAAFDHAISTVETTAFMNAIDPDPKHNTFRMFWLKCHAGWSDKAADVERAAEMLDNVDPAVAEAALAAAVAADAALQAARKAQ